MSRHRPFAPLADAQALATHPRRLVWLSASAGTGKTYVLAARVLRLLLAGTDPAAILCLTFTKAGAAEMAERVHAVLAAWVRLPAAKLAADLRALGEDFAPDSVARARTLFARVLDATGGGLRIQTIHAFCQTLLGAFPAEAGLVPGFRLIEDRESAALARSALADMLVAAQEGGDLPLVRDVETLSRRLGEERAEAFLRQCARNHAALAALGAAPGIEANVRHGLGLPLGDVEAAIAEGCERIDCAALDRIHAANAAWATASGRERVAAIEAWRALAPGERADGLAALHLVWATAKGERRATGKGKAPPDDGYDVDASDLFNACHALLAMRAKAAFAALLGAALRAGQAYARAVAEAKRAAGAVDFDDLIRLTIDLLAGDGAGEWIRWKLDRRTDHILVDEAQDTNAAQWAIVRALAEEYWREAAEDGVPVRTLFAVGDFKQAIFGFQGTSPLFFEAAGAGFFAQADAGGRAFERLSLDQSFRSTQPVLNVVDALLGQLGQDAIGLFDPPPPHVARKAGEGRVTLWAPVSVETEEDDAPADGEEGWLDDATRLFADRLAAQVRAWLDDPPWLSTRARPLRPEDVMILVRKRGELASLIVARLHERGVPVAGVDRLRLDAPLAVRDLLAAARFAAQPEDDLTLANLLVSPLFGFDQEALFAVAQPRTTTLLTAVRERPEHAATAHALDAILAAADLVTPYRFFEELLSGPLDARRRLLARLGEEARDPIEELLNAALRFEEEGQPLLQPFLDWFDRGEVQIKRDPSAPLDAVRVMTVHGAKGLQAPVVVLADATGDPDRSPPGDIAWEIAGGVTVPIPRPRKEERFAPFDALMAEAAARDRQEHWRLLYVAATRAEERLYVGGALGPMAKGVPPSQSWYTALGGALDGLGAVAADDAAWRTTTTYAGGTPVPARARRAGPVGTPPPLPAWLRAPAPREEQPPRPLAPSAIGRDDIAFAPAAPAQAAAAARGRLLHQLFERLPTCAPAERHGVAIRWLTAAGVAADEAEAIAAEGCAVLADPRFAAVFAADALAEAPIAATVGGQVVAGTVDRLLVTADAVTVVDFKSARRVPNGLRDVPRHHLDQIGAYAAALAVVFPDRAVRAGLLYTAGPVLIDVDAATLARHKPGLGASSQSYDAAG